MIDQHVLKSQLLRVFSRLPAPLRAAIKERYSSRIEAEFRATFFDSVEEYDRYRWEFEREGVVATRDEALASVQRAEMQRSQLDAVTGARMYALVRALEPETVVETGVAHGFSTLVILSALERNGHGTLYSIDYPHYADVPIEEFRRQTRRDFGGASTIPPGRGPGWIVPEELRSRWEFREGKVQRELPKLLASLESVDLYVRDSEHTVPCMLFEFEAGWEWLAPGGVLLSDDIQWNAAFDLFVEARTPPHGRVTPTMGYVRKPGE